MTLYHYNYSTLLLVIANFLMGLILKDFSGYKKKLYRAQHVLLLEPFEAFYVCPWVKGTIVICFQFPHKCFLSSSQLAWQKH